MMAELLFLIVPLLLVAPLALAQINERVELAVTRIALGVFGDYVSKEGDRKRTQRDRLHAAHVGAVHRMFAARTLFWAAVMGLAGSLVGVYAAALGLRALQVGPEAIRAAVPATLGFLGALARLTEAGPAQLFALFVFSSGTIGAALALLTYFGRWELLDQRAGARGSEIEATLPRTVAFVYALSRSGMPFPAVLDTLTENEDVYGEAARELGVAVRDMHTFGTDVLTAMEGMARRTPSENMVEFGENLASVMGSGKRLSEFLREQYEQYQEEAEAQQARYLELLATFAEAYVTVLVAGVLFLVTILAVIGLVLQNTLPVLQFIAYLGVPLASFGFIVYLDAITNDPAGGDSDVEEGTDGRLYARTGQTASMPRPAPPGRVGISRTDGGRPALEGDATGRWQVNRERLAIYDRLERVRRWLRQPKRRLLERPVNTLALTAPLALLWIGLRVGAVPLEPMPALRTLDSPVIEAGVVVLGTYGVVYELEKRRIRAMEAAVPDYLERLASVNEAGMTVVESLRRLTRSQLGALTPEVQRTWRDVQWGADVATAFRRMDSRVDSAMVSRAITLVANAMEASGDVAPVLSIAADEARATRRLRRERRATMLTYLLVIYLSFFVFLGIVAALTASFIPAVENAQFAAGTAPASGVTPGVFGSLDGVNPAAYQLVFYHSAAIQAVCSGLIAGQLGEGKVRDGVKHATVLLATAYIAFALIGI